MADEEKTIEIKEEDIQKLPEQQPVTAIVPANNVFDIIQSAVEKLGGEGAEATVAAIERLVDLQQRMSQEEAKKEFYDALAKFQDECPPIKKTSTASIASKSGSSYKYKYAELDEIARTVKPYLFHRGLSFTWNCESQDNIITAICYLRHRNGHEIQSKFQAPVPTTLGSMNDIQRHAAVLTYAKRQALVEVLGLTTTEIDTDAVSPETIDEKQIKLIRMRIDSSGADEKKLCRYMGVEKLGDIRKADLATVMLALDQKADKKPPVKPEQAIDTKKLADLYTDLHNLLSKIEENKKTLEIGDEWIEKQKGVISREMSGEEAEKLKINYREILEGI